MSNNTRDSRVYKVRMDETNRDHGIGLEVHVEGWGASPFFTVRGFDGQSALLSTRYSKRIKYRVPFKRCYFTNKCGSYFQRKLNGAKP